MSEDIAGRMREALQRFLNTIAQLPWGTSEDEFSETMPFPPVWRIRHAKLVGYAVARVFQNEEAAQQLRTAMDGFSDRVPQWSGKPQDVVDVSKALTDAADSAEALIDAAVMTISSPAERRLATEVALAVRTRCRFIDQHHSGNEASLVVAVAAVELLMGELVRAFYVRYPDALKGLSRDIPAREVLDALEHGYDLRERLLDEAVDAVIGKAPAGVRKWFEDQRPLDLDLNVKCVGSWAALAEVFERRHTIVHSGTVVTTRYLAMVVGSPPLGSSLQIPSDYIINAFDGLLAFGISLLADVWAHLYPAHLLAIVSAVMDTIGRVQHLWDQAHDPWPTLGVITDTLVRIGNLATGADAEGVRVLTRLTKLWCDWNAAVVADGTRPQTTIAQWDVGPSVVEQFAVAALRGDNQAVAALVDDAIQSPAFVMLSLLPPGMEPVKEAARTRSPDP